MSGMHSTSLDVVCPNPKCGLTGKVPFNRLDRQFTCKGCGTKFFMDPRGARMNIGARPAGFVDPLVTAAPPKYRPLVVERAEQWWARRSDVQKTIVKAALILALFVPLAATGVRAYFTPPSRLPKDLRGRAAYVVKALARNDAPALVAIVDPESLKDAKPWLRKVRPVTWPRTYMLPKATIAITGQNLKQGKGTVRVTIESPEASTPKPTGGGAKPKADAESEKESPTSKSEETEKNVAEKSDVPSEPEPPKPLSLTLFWVYRDGVWLFDAASSLKYSP